MADFPNFPGLSIDVTRSILFSTTVHTSDAQKEQRTSWQQIERYRFKVSLEVLDELGGDVDRLLSFIDAHRGGLGSFTFTDPYDGVDKRVRFDMDDYEIERIVTGAWKMAVLEMVTVS